MPQQPISNRKNKEKPFQKLLRIEQMLRSGKHTIAEISTHIGIDSRSVFRYFDRIASMGVKIQSGSRDGRLKEYWIPREDHAIPPQIIQSLKEMDQELTQGGSRKFHKLITTVQQLLKQEKPPLGFDPTINNPDFQLDHGPLAEYIPSDSLQHEIVDKLLQAIHKRTRLNIEYIHSDSVNKISRFSFDPYRIYLRVGKLYLLGMRKGSGDIQTLVVKRIRMFSSTPETFTRKELDLDHHFKYCFGQWVPRQEQEIAAIRLKTKEAWLIKLFRESHFDPQVKLAENGDGAYTITLKLYLTPDLESWLFGLLPHMEILEPKSLRAKLLKRAQTAVKILQNA